MTTMTIKFPACPEHRKLCQARTYTATFSSKSPETRTAWECEEPDCKAPLVWVELQGLVSQMV